MLLVSLLVFHRAQPEFETFFDRFYRLDLRTHWDMTYVHYVVHAIMMGFMICLAGIGLSLVRARRKTDSKKHILLLGVLYVILSSISWFLL